MTLEIKIPHFSDFLICFVPVFSVWTVITNYHNWMSYKQHDFSWFRRLESLWSKLSAWLGSAEVSSVEDCHLLLVSSHGWEKTRTLFRGLFLFRALVPLMRNSFSWHHYLPKSQLLTTIKFGVKISTYKFWGDTNIQFIADYTEVFIGYPR